MHTQTRASELQPLRACSKGAAARTVGAAPCALIVDDDDLFRASLAENLEDAGYCVISKPGGAPALACLRDRRRVDVILLDWRMPEMDGVEFLRRLRDADFDMPVIFLTVLSDELYEEAALELGAVDFVEKSRSPSILLRRMEIIIEGQKQAAEASSSAAGDTAMSVIENYGRLALRKDIGRAYWDKARVDLTLTEFKIVKLLVDLDGEDASYRQIYDQVQGEGFIAGFGDDGFRSNVRNHIKRIRQKFRAVDPAFKAIENYPRFGYRWAHDG